MSIARTCLKKSVNRLRTSKIFKNVIRDKWHDVDIKTVRIRKAMLQYKKRSLAAAKQDGELI